MANISEAKGYITLDGPWTKEQIVNILYVLYSQDCSYDYTMNIFAQKLIEDVDELSKGLSLSFYGSGRWAFTANLESFDNWTDLSENNYKSTRTYDMGIPYEEYTQKRKEVMLDMVRNKLSIHFDFADIEPGLDVAYKTNAEIAAEYYYDTTTRTSETQFVTLEGNTQSYECNMKFLCEEIRNDDQSLYDFLYEYATYKKIPFKDSDHKNATLDRVGQSVASDDEWYNLAVYPDVELFEEYYKETADIINKLIDRYLKETS